MIEPISQPNFLCIGAQKAGTTWLYNALKMHNDVWLPPLKELHYFDISKSNNYKNEKLKEIKTNIDKIIAGQNVNYARLKCLSKLFLSEKVTDEIYLSIFQDKHAIAIGEITPSYSTLNESEVKHIYDLLGDLKIIFILRDPISRAWSQVRMNFEKSRKSKLTEEDCKSLNSEYWMKFIQKRISGIDARTNYIRTSMLYEKYFSQIHYAFYDELCQNPRIFLKNICNFLGIRFEESMFGNILTARKLVGMEVDIPEKCKKFFSDRYKEQEEFMRVIHRRRSPVMEEKNTSTQELKIGASR